MDATFTFVLQVVALVAIFIGCLFSLVGVLGLIRLPDIYTRLHAVGKVSVFGAVLLAMAAALLSAIPIGKALLLITLLVIAGPVVSHAIGSAGYRMGLPLKRIVRDDLTAHIGTNSQKPADTTMTGETV
jgi:multicomponent Na+:H+ antiporter subunit G